MEFLEAVEGMENGLLEREGAFGGIPLSPGVPLTPRFEETTSRRSGHSKPKVCFSEAGLFCTSACCPAVSIGCIPTTAPDYAKVRSAVPTEWVRICRGPSAIEIPLVPILAPFPNVSTHIVTTHRARAIRRLNVSIRTHVCSVEPTHW